MRNKSKDQVPYFICYLTIIILVAVCIDNFKINISLLNGQKKTSTCVIECLTVIYPEVYTISFNYFIFLLPVYIILYVTSV
jgi:hypothetical protein